MKYVVYNTVNIFIHFNYKSLVKLKYSLNRNKYSNLKV